MGQITNVNMGVCSVKLNGVDLGHTKGGVEVTYKPDFADITVDLYGDSVVDKRLKAEEFSAKIPLAEATLANLKRVIPAGTLTESGGKTALKIGRQAGYLLSANAAQLVLHPVVNDASDISEDIVLWKAVQIGEIKLALNNEDMEIMEGEFLALIDESKTAGNYLATIGDTTI